MILFYIKELEHDVARKPLTLFGIMFWSAWEQVKP
jgi:hypothetical protein